MSLDALKQYLELLKLSGIEELFLKDINFTENLDKSNNKRINNNCDTCPLVNERTNFVPSRGKKDSDLFIIGDVPSQMDVEEGLPFTGAVGELLEKMLKAININIEDVFLTNVVKCRPLSGRKPFPAEINKCLPTIYNEILSIKPKAILILGRTTAINFLKKVKSMDDFRSESHKFEGIMTFVTYHPIELINNSSLKKPAYIDLLRLQKYLSEQ